VNAPSTEIRAAVTAEFARSSARKVSACSSVVSSVASVAATKASPARTMSIASLTLANTGVVPIRVTSFGVRRGSVLAAVLYSLVLSAPEWLLQSRL
jgi:hypothetical protein